MSKRTRLTRRSKALITQLGLKGFSARQIAEQVPVSKSTVAAFLATSDGHQRPQFDLDFIEAWNSGKPPDLIARENGWKSSRYVYTKACRLRGDLGSPGERHGRILISPPQSDAESSEQPSHPDRPTSSPTT